jgi:DNA-binding IscR family transcriptional regulator
LLKNIDITKLADRDSQEIVGYFNTLDLISEKLAIPNSTVKRILSALRAKSLLEQHGKGRNVTYLAK